jgi:fused signal recognition particle receptor
MYRKATIFTLVLALVVIVLGSYVRSSGVELGCPDWPGCYGKALVSSDAEFMADAKANFPYSHVDLNKAKKEMTYRYFTGFLAISILILALFSWAQKKCRLATLTSTLLLLVLIGIQTAFAMWAVELKGMPVIITGQVLLGFSLFWGMYWLYLRTNKNVIIADQTIKRGPRTFARFAILILVLQIILGVWTSTNGAALACTGFPKCNNTWVPAVDYLNALALFSGLNSGYTGVLSFDGQVAVHWIHRVGALVCFIFLTWLMFNATAEKNVKKIRKAGVQLSILLLIQMLLGVYIVKLQLPLVIAVAHNLFALMLMLPLISISFYSKYALIGDVEDFEGIEEKAIDTQAEVEELYVEPTAESLYLRLTTQLKKTRTGLGSVLSGIPLGQKEINADLLEQIESSLLMADIGVDVTGDIISQLTQNLERHQLNDGEALETTLKQILLDILQPSCQPLIIPQQDGPYVILVVGINGVGKTTTIGKLAKRLQVQGHSVMLAAGDTFRAAAVEQLETWGERNNIYVVAQHTGADSASVIFDGVQSAKAKGVDVLIADTAGRLHTKSNLMEELSKIKRIMGKVDDTAPHEVLLVLDAGTGQNAISQTKLFNETVELTGLALTKLDGTAKGGVIFALAKQFALPIRFIGVGEGIDDLQDFDAQAFVDALFVKD